MPELSFADVDAGVRATIAVYAQALDDGRADDIAATFCTDGVCEIPGMATLEGLDAIREGFAGWIPQRPQRHLVVNTAITEWDDDRAKASSDLVFVLQGRSGWNVQMVGRYHDVFHREGDRWLIHHRRAEFVAPPDPPSATAEER
jgi:uncharacterized protein (TIGR02246 family)